MGNKKNKKQQKKYQMHGVVKQQKYQMHGVVKLVQISQSTSVAEDLDEPSTSTQQAELDVDLQLDNL